MSAAMLVDIVLAAIVVEAVLLIVLLRDRPAHVRAGVFVTLAAGAALVVTLRAVISGAAPALLAVCLFVSLLAHLADLYLRLNRSP